MDCISHSSDVLTFWSLLDRLVAESVLVVDRPAGTTHPRFPDFVYPYDYGYLANTRSMDGDGIDVWIGSLPDRRVTGVIGTVDLDKRDAEIKILIGCTAHEMQTILTIHNDGLQGGVLIQRGV